MSCPYALLDHKTLGFPWSVISSWFDEVICQDLRPHLGVTWLIDCSWGDDHYTW